VSLVEDHGVVLGQDTGALGPLPESQVGEIERVIRDHELRLGRARPGRLRVARSDVGATPAGAAVAPDRQLRPEGGARLEVELGAVTRFGGFDPLRQSLVPCRVLGALKEPAQLIGAGNAFAAEVVLTPFEHCHAHRPAQSGRGGRHVLRQELLLQRLRRRRHDHPLARYEGREEVGQALARSRAGLCEEVLLAGQRVRDRLRETGLPGAWLEARQGSSEAA
jgi:hypothetical protein